MKLPKYSQSCLSKPYFRFLIKQYLPLALIPMAIFTGLFMLSGFGELFSTLLLGLFSVGIVPLMAILLTRQYTQKGEISYNLAIPMTRKQHFFTTYLVGLVIIIVPIIYMTSVIQLVLQQEFRTFSSIVLMMLFDGFVYYSIAMLACIMQGTLFNQIFSMGIFAFGPVLLYMVIKVVIGTLSFRPGTVISELLIKALCPLYTGFTILEYNDISGFVYVHLLLGIACVFATYFIQQNRPNEKSGSLVYQRVNHYIIEPFLFLIIFNLIIVSSLEIFGNHYYDESYYFKIYSYMLCTGLIVSFFISTWTSKSLKELFNPRHLLHYLFYSMLGFVLIVVPLYLSDNQKGLERIDECSISGYSYYSTIRSDQNEIALYNWCLENKEYFRNNGSIMLRFRAYDDDYSQYEYYYLDTQKDLPQEFKDLFTDIIRRNREVVFEKPVLQINDALYKAQDLKLAIEQSYQDQLPDNYFLRSEFNIPTEIYAIPENFIDIYGYTLSSLSYDEWLQSIISACKPALDENKTKELKEIALQKAIEKLEQENFNCEDYYLDLSQVTTFTDDEICVTLEPLGWVKKEPEISKEDETYDEEYEEYEEYYTRYLVQVYFTRNGDTFEFKDIVIEQQEEGVQYA